MKFNWRFALKIAGIAFCAILFIVLAIVIYVNHLEPLPMDVGMRDFCYNIRGEKYGFGYWFFRIITEFGNFYVICIIVLVITIYTKCDFRAILMALGILCAVMLNIGLKGLYMRERPFTDMRWMDEYSTSFPSGHSTAAGFMYSYMIYLAFHSNLKEKWKYVIYVSCGILIPLVMFSRMILGVHYFSDVLAGVSVGIMVSCAFMWFYKVCVKYDFITEGLITKIVNARTKKDKPE